MSITLTEKYQELVPGISVIYIFPRIKEFSRHNPYLLEFYKELLSTDSVIRCTSPHPLRPFFIVRKVLGEKSIVHYHWLECNDFRGLGVLLWKMTLVALYRLCGGYVIWTIHNRYPHAGKYKTINNVVRRYMAKIAGRLHVHCNEAITEMAPLLRVAAEKFFVIPHPLYPVRIIDAFEAKAFIKKFSPELDQAKTIFIMYGQIAPYKGILEVVELFPQLCGCQLIIAGTYKKGACSYLQEIEKRCKEKNNIILIKRFLSDKEEMNLFNAADCVVFNFKDILTSGAVVLAQSYRKPIIIPFIGCLKALSGPGVHTFHSRQELEMLLNRLASNSDSLSA